MVKTVEALQYSVPASHSTVPPLIMVAPTILRFPGLLKVRVAALEVTNSPVKLPPVQLNAFETVRAGPALSVAEPPRLTVPTFVAALNVGVPLVMVAVSIPPGTPCGLQLVGLNQLPESPVAEPVQVNVPALADTAKPIIITNKTPMPRAGHRNLTL